MTASKIIRQLLDSEGDEEKRQPKIILNLLLLLSLAALMVINIIRIIDLFKYPEEKGIPAWCTLLLFILFLFLYYWARRGATRLVTIILIISYSLPAAYSLITWGVDLPAGLLLVALIITLSGVLLSATSALASTILISSALLILTYLQNHGLINVQNYWRQERADIADTIVYVTLLIIIAVIAWLFVHGLQKALIRARKSERDLKLERDSLETKVIERTEQLRQAEAEKMHQLYRLAEFGRLSSGIFHDLINPLTAVSLNLEQINDDKPNQDLPETKSYLKQAILATKRMSGLIGGIKKQLQRESTETIFLVNEEIKQTIQILSYKAREAGVTITFNRREKINLYGDAIKFNQIITNLLANAIEATTSQTRNANIIIKIYRQQKFLIIKVSDTGQGIAPENQEKIFKPFFSTKHGAQQGLGLGLSSTKHIVDTNFNGAITVTSRLGLGSTFTISLPIKL